MKRDYQEWLRRFEKNRNSKKKNKIIAIKNYMQVLNNKLYT